MKTVVLSGAGISPESGLKTFRGDGGLWEGHRVEDVPALEQAARIVARADIFLCVGTSLQVYPANSLIFATPRHARRIIINPEVPDLVPQDVCECLAQPACVGVPVLVETLLREAGSRAGTA
jgi:NAD-dependent SIR2 family protein deacetylase